MNSNKMMHTLDLERLLKNEYKKYNDSQTQKNILIENILVGAIVVVVG
jgi:hypothetical protein